MKKWFSPLCLGLFCLMLAGLSHWKVFEADVFWQIRQGEEASELGQYSKPIDHWSTTADPEPWYNYQWLSGVAFYKISKLAPDYRYLPTLRAILVLVLLLGILWISWTPSAFFTQVSWLSLFWIAAWGRLSLRPELLGALCFVAMVRVAVCEITKGWVKVGLWAVLIALWSMMHGGTAPFGIIFAGLALVFSDTLSVQLGGSTIKRLLALFILVSSWFATPIGWHIVQVFYKTVFLYDWSLLLNPDQQPFMPELLLVPRFGLGMVAWVFLGWVGVLCLKRPQAYPGLYGDRKFVNVLVLFFTLLVFGKIRSRIYHLIAIAPLVVPYLESVSAKIRKSGKLVFAVLALLPLSMLAAEVVYFAPALGFGLLPGFFPVAAIDWIKTHHPQGPLYNAYRFGGYLVQELRDYPVSEDGRSIPFLGFRRELTPALESPETFNLFLKQKGFNLAIDDPGFGYYSKAEWERVFIDQTAAVYVRK